MLRDVRLEGCRSNLRFEEVVSTSSNPKQENRTSRKTCKMRMAHVIGHASGEGQRPSPERSSSKTIRYSTERRGVLRPVKYFVRNSSLSVMGRRLVPDGTRQVEER